MNYLLANEIEISEKEKLISKLQNLDRQLKLVVLVNEEDKSSLGYLKAIKNMANKLNVIVEELFLKQEEDIYLSTIKKLNIDDTVDGVLITRPLKKGLDENKIILALDPNKDVDGIHPYNLGKLLFGQEEIVPNTALAMIKMVEYHNIQLEGKKVLIIGRSISVGKPIALLLLNRNATISIAHSRSKNLNDELKNYDLVFVAIGKPELIDAKYMKEGAICIDAGIHYLEDRICGDVLPNEKLSYISKVPGGVGKITTLCLFINLLKCYEVRYGK